MNKSRSFFFDMVTLVVTIIASLGIVVLAWWAFRTAFLDMARNMDPDGGLIVLGISLVLLALLGGLSLLLIGTAIYPAAEWLSRFLEADAGRRKVQREQRENARIAEELAADTSAKAELDAVLVRQRRAAYLDRNDWETIAAAELRPMSNTDRNVGIFVRYASATAAQRHLIRQGYMTLLNRAHPRHEYFSPLDVDAVPAAARLLYLAVAIDADDGIGGFDYLDFDLSDHDRRRYVYRSPRRMADFEHWSRSLPAIDSYLGGRWRISRMSGTAIVLSALPDIPPVYPLEATMLKPDHLFLGRDLNTGASFHLPIASLAHTLLQGPSGQGKSTFMHVLMASVITNTEAFDEIYMIDLKSGLEARRYARLSPKITVVDDHAGVDGVLTRLEALMAERLSNMLDRDITDWDGGRVLVIVDEFSDMLMALTKAADRTALETRLTRLAAKSRAMGIRLWIQVQNSTADSVPTSFKRNLVTRIAFKQTNLEAVSMFGSTEDMPADLPTLRKGQVIYQDGNTSERYALQAPFLTYADVARIAVERGSADVPLPPPLPNAARKTAPL